MKIILLLLMALCTSCAMTGIHVAQKVIMASGYDNPPKPVHEYKAGDKIDLWGEYSGSETCDVLYATSNPYSLTPMLSRYEVKCADELDSRTVTSDDLARMRYLKEAYDKEKSVIAQD